LQKDVSAVLKALPGLECEDEAVDGASGYSIDILVKLNKGGHRIAVEVDGPSHFYASGKKPLGATLLKRRHLGLLGYKVVSVPYFEWMLLKDSGAKTEYVRGKVWGNIA
jgi:hypothetical protein